MITQGNDWMQSEILRDSSGVALFSRNRQNRRTLRRWWVNHPAKFAAWLMLNPSTATDKIDDPTTRRVTHFSKLWGYDGWIIVNLFPFISSDPRKLWNWIKWDEHGPDWYARDDIAQNRSDIEAVAREAAIRVVAFGAQPIIRCEGELECCLEAFSQPAIQYTQDEKFYCLGVNKSGQPLHPLARGKMRVPNDKKPELWRRE